METLQAHLETGCTTLARCWAVERDDGMTLGFTDHDRDLAFEGLVFCADTGLTARALSQTTGLSVDNTEALGVLSADAITEVDIDAGRYDRAVVRAWLVNWADVGQRQLQFRGSIGEITRRGPAFDAELRGLAEALSQPQGRIYQRPCAAVLGDAACGVDLDAPGLSVTATPTQIDRAQVFRFDAMTAPAAGFFERGRLVALDGAADGLWGVIKRDEIEGGTRVVTLWAPLRDPVAGEVRLEAGCDKRAETCRVKFGNLVNFRGFPDIPGEDWLARVPRRDGINNGGRLR